ncbi:unknown [Clostridium sp. CAG:448]|nr:unknown [Clostridium sp. CAG:448]
MFCRHILMQIRDGIALGLQIFDIKGRPGRRYGINTRGMVNEIRLKHAAFDLLRRQIARQLTDNGTDHFQMPEFFRAQRSIGNVPMYQIRGQA